MQRSSDRILTTHVGSLPRPSALTDLLYAKDANALEDRGAFESAVQTATTAAVRRQLECGIDIVNDGEMSKVSYVTYVRDRLSGFGGESTPLRSPEFAAFPEFFQRRSRPRSPKTPACTGPVVRTDTLGIGRDAGTLAQALGDAKPADAFLTAASPGVIALFMENRFYESYEKYIESLAAALKAEYEAIHEAGYILQLDCPDLAGGRHVAFANEPLERFQKVIALHVEAINQATANIPPERMRLHLCWGNYEGPHHLDVPLRDILPIVLTARPDGLSFEAANPRHGHEWRVFEGIKLPPGKVLLPGVLDSCTNYIEHPELVADRICQFARLVGRENVIASADCGFATFAGSSAVDPEITWAKLGSMVEGARIASRRLW